MTPAGQIRYVAQIDDSAQGCANFVQIA